MIIGFLAKLEGPDLGWLQRHLLDYVEDVPLEAVGVLHLVGRIGRQVTEWPRRGEGQSTLLPLALFVRRLAFHLLNLIVDLY